MAQVDIVAVRQDLDYSGPPRFFLTTHANLFDAQHNPTIQGQRLLRALASDAGVCRVEPTDNRCELLLTPARSSRTSGKDSDALLVYLRKQLKWPDVQIRFQRSQKSSARTYLKVFSNRYIIEADQKEVVALPDVIEIGVAPQRLDVWYRDGTHILTLRDAIECILTY